jgi:hypothetical protein
VGEGSTPASGGGGVELGPLKDERDEDLVEDPGREEDRETGRPDTTLSRIAIEFMVNGSADCGSVRFVAASSSAVVSVLVLAANNVTMLQACREVLLGIVLCVRWMASRPVRELSYTSTPFVVVVVQHSLLPMRPVSLALSLGRAKVN